MALIAEASPLKEDLHSAYDAIHLLVYGVKQTPSGPKPNTLGLMQLNVCMDLLEKNLAKNVVIGGVNYGVVQGDSRISKVYADTLRGRIENKRIKGVKVIVEAEVTPEAQIESGSKDTGGEIDFLLNQAAVNDWHNIMSIGYGPHVERITKLYRPRGINVSDEKEGALNVEVRDSNNLLQAKHPEFRTKFERSPYRENEGDSFIKKEKLKIMIMDLIDKKGSVMTWMARHTPNDLKLRLNI